MSNEIMIWLGLVNIFALCWCLYLVDCTLRQILNEIGRHR